MRGRLLLALVVMTTVVAVAIGVLTVARTATPDGTPSSVVAVDVAALHPGDVTSVEATLPHRSHPDRTVLVANVPGDGLRAYLARDTQSGCRIRWTGDSSYKPFTHSENVSFEDPCHGSVYALDGTCVGGPCPRALDGYRVERVDHTAQIDLGHLMRGAARATS